MFPCRSRGGAIDLTRRVKKQALAFFVHCPAEQIEFDDYRDVDGVKLPFTVRVQSVEPGLVSTRTFAEIKINVPVEDSKFNMPPKP
jgi:hypothetical protein